MASGLLRWWRCGVAGWLWRGLDAGHDQLQIGAIEVLAVEVTVEGDAVVGGQDYAGERLGFDGERASDASDVLADEFPEGADRFEPFGGHAFASVGVA